MTPTRSNRLLRSSAAPSAAAAAPTPPRLIEPKPKPAVTTMTRRSPRDKQEVSKFNLRSDIVIRHQLLLGPTLARQAKKRRERARAEHIKRVSQKMSPSQIMQSDARPSSGSSSNITNSNYTRPGGVTTFINVGSKLPKTPTKMKLSPATPITPESVESTKHTDESKKNSNHKNNNKPVLDRNNKNSDNTCKSGCGGVKNNAPKKRKHESSSPSSSSSGSDGMGHRPSKSRRYATRGQTRRSGQIPFPKDDDNHFHQDDRLYADTGSSGGGGIQSKTTETTTKARDQTPQQYIDDDSSYRDDPIAIQRKMKVMKRKQLATEALMMATDMTSIFAALWAFHQLHVDDDMDPHLLALLSNNQESGHYLLTKLLLEKFTSPRCFGGLAFSDTNAHMLINKLLINFGGSFGALDITLERLTDVGIPPLVAYEIHPHLSSVVNETRAKIHFLFKHIMDATDDN